MRLAFQCLGFDRRERAVEIAPGSSQRVEACPATPARYVTRQAGAERDEPMQLTASAVVTGNHGPRPAISAPVPSRPLGKTICSGALISLYYCLK